MTLAIEGFPNSGMIVHDEFANIPLTQTDFKVKWPQIQENRCVAVQSGTI
jgi:hypothetical protein